ncbi:hypothetical protein ACWPKS_01435 [Coraliomargarita sp. W4R72]
MDDELGIKNSAVGTGTGSFSCRVLHARQLCLTFATLILSVTALQAAPVRVVEETAIPYMSFLSKVDFDQRYPGELIEDPATLDAGWYVIYEHEMLNYYFGPILLESIGQDYLGQLTETVEAAVAQRPSIQDYRLELSYEPSVASSDNSSVEPPAESSLPPQESKPSFWSMVKKAFGF